VHGIGDIALGFQIHNGRRAVTGIKELADQSDVTNNDPAPSQRSRASDESVSTR
jgi:hypothetical protein